MSEWGRKTCFCDIPSPAYGLSTANIHKAGNLQFSEHGVPTNTVYNPVAAGGHAILLIRTSVIFIIHLKNVVWKKSISVGHFNFRQIAEI